MVGKDILDLLSSSMYIDPMAIYREYVQNAADAIDAARAMRLFNDDSDGRVDFTVDIETRTVKIKDNGIGVNQSEFTQRLTSFGASSKRGKHARGFRGVGRLAGIGYCQELIFRTRAKGEAIVSELRWDCKRLKNVLSSTNADMDLSELVRDTVTIRHLPAGDWPEHFFEVELRGIVRHRNDQLLNPNAVYAYLAQVAPVPFSPDFSYGDQIEAALRSVVNLTNLDIWISSIQDPVYRPHRNSLNLGPADSDEFQDSEFFTIPGIDGNAVATGWVLHHGYTGALPTHTKVKGLRMRVGNMQIGDDRLMEELFPEPRFNGWVVGEIHIIDERVIPNCWRDHFEQNVHFHNLLTHLSPIARELSRKCRLSSIARNRSREFQRRVQIGKEKLAIIKQRSLGRADQARLLREVYGLIADLEKLATADAAACSRMA